MRSRIGPLACAGLLVLTGCQTTERIRYKEARVAVSAPCVVDRPEKTPNLLTSHPDGIWGVMPPGAKAAAVEARAGERMNYTDRLEAATSGCKEVK